MKTIKAVNNFIGRHKYPLLAAACHEIRFEILRMLENRSLVYSEIYDQIESKKKGDGGIAFHLQVLKQLHLIDKKESNRQYYTTVKGLNVLHGAKAINEAEMFI